LPIPKGDGNGNRVQKRPEKVGYRFFLQRQTWKRYAWATEEEAKKVEAAHRTDLLQNPPLRTDSIANVAALYLTDSTERGRSKWRLEALRYNFDKFILPFFKPETPMSAITEADLRNSSASQTARR
jgi:hypothetical protein